MVVVATTVLAAAAAASVASQLFGSAKQGKKDRELDSLLADRRKELEGSRGDIGTYFDELLAASNQGFDLKKDSAFDKFRDNSLDIQTEGDLVAGKTGFSSSNVATSKTDRQLERSDAGLAETLAGLGQQQESDTLGIETGRTDAYSQLDSDIFNIDTARSGLDTDNFLNKLFG